jgi:type I restriction enzyme M protein
MAKICLRGENTSPNKAEERPLRDPEVILNEIALLDRESEEILEGIRGML